MYMYVSFLRTSDEPQHDLESSRRVHYEGLKKVNYGLTS